MTERTLRIQLVELGASLFARGYSVGGAGNISALLPDGNLLATPTNACLGRLSSDELSVTDMGGVHIGGKPPTKEIGLHIAMYKANPACKAVVHLHSTYVTALSCLADIDTTNAMRPLTPYYVMKVGRLPVVPYYEPGSPALVAAAEAIKDASAFLLGNHGAVVCGASLAEAVNSAEELEESAKLHFILHTSNRPVRYLSNTETASLLCRGSTTDFSSGR
jgi:ribulose-5-phosphate 4-epimerase/fuculose-1-phosphate aldolase